MELYNQINQRKKRQDMQFEGFHAVEPRKDCPHCTDRFIAPKEDFTDVHVNDPCAECGNKGENWVCLSPGCKAVYCSRYVKNHMVRHNMENPEHCIVFSFADFSFWCYACDDYVVSDKLDHGKAFFEQKFGEASQKEVFKIMKDSKHQD